MIGKDVHRTFPDENIFKEDITKGRNKLYNILKAYAMLDRKVGYC